MMSRNKEMALIHVVEAVDRALVKYSSDNVDVVKNEETGKVDIIYHSRNNSFPIEVGVADADDIDMAVLSRDLNDRNVGYCW